MITTSIKAAVPAQEGNVSVNATQVGAVINNAEMAAHYSPEEYALEQEAINNRLLFKAGDNVETMVRLLEILARHPEMLETDSAAEQAEIPSEEGTVQTFSEEAKQATMEADDTPAQQEKPITFQAKVRILPDGSMTLKPTKRWRKKVAKNYPHKLKGRMWAQDKESGTITFQPYTKPTSDRPKAVLKTHLWDLDVKKKHNGDVSLTYTVSAEDLEYPMVVLERLREQFTVLDIYMEPLCYSLAEASDLDEFNEMYDANAGVYHKALHELEDDPYEDDNDPLVEIKYQGALGSRVKSHLMAEGTHPYMQTIQIPAIANAEA